ncbi:MBOAT family O-acyltransferase [Ilumatobacter sp.]|uniref:MBOAT family O-acyltransferase n=1 Tax=Ilumatobacter sp. TaxID=1967498 RepID=UPI003B5286EE
MVFNSITFAAFLPLVLIAHWAVPPQKRNLVLLVASYVFYGWWDWRFLALIALSTVVDFAVGLAIGASRDERSRSRLLAVSLVVNLGVLAVFKYAGFFVDSANELLGGLGLSAAGPTLEVLLPVGISFYTFQTISYSFDVHRRRIEPTADLVVFATYVAYFPQLVAGPIERAQRLLPRIATPAARTFPRGRDLDRAMSLFLSGLFKKVVLADGIAPVVDEVFADPGGASGIAVAAGVVAFAIQLYGDFSGYTDMARGVSELFGIDLMVNFRQPYLSRNITEFWRRWHVSLSDWLREYLYIPLGGNRGSGVATIRNLMITMLLGGLWHGASWNFVVWGAIHGVALVVHRLVAGGRVPVRRLSITQVPAILATFAIWCASMVFFRAATLADAGAVLSALATPLAGRRAWGSVGLVAVFAVVTVALDLAQRRADESNVAERDRDGADGERTPARAPAGSLSPRRVAGSCGADLVSARRLPASSAGRGVLAGVAVVAIVVYSGGIPSPFIYFQF